MVFKESREKTAAKIAEYYKSEQAAKAEKPDFDVERSRLEAARQFFREEIEELLTNPDVYLMERDKDEAHAILSGQSATKTGHISMWDDMLARICQQFRLKPEQSRSLIEEFFTRADSNS